MTNELTELTFYQRLDLARQEFPPIIKNKVNPHFRSRYADLEAVLSAVEPALRKYDLGIQQTTEPGILTTAVVDLLDDAQRLESSMELPTGVDPQKIGSAITYARRYTLVTLLGLVTEDDDDANGATEAPAPKAAKPKPVAPNPAANPAANTRDRNAGWISPEDRAQAHDELVARIAKLDDENTAALRNLSHDLGGFPLPFDRFSQLEAAVKLAGG